MVTDVLFSESRCLPLSWWRHELSDDYVYWLLNSDRSGFKIDDSKLLNLKWQKAGDLAKDMTKHWYPSFKYLIGLQDRSRTSLLPVLSNPFDVLRWHR